MSSHEFRAVLTPERRLRSIVLLSATTATVVGFMLIIHIALAVVPRAILLAAWLVSCWLEFCAMADGSRRVTLIRVSNLGEVWVAAGNGDLEPVKLLPGSVVLERFAWLRIRFEDGGNYAELLAGNAVKDRQWHRFQLIWQQSRQYFGGHIGGTR